MPGQTSPDRANDAATPTWDELLQLSESQSDDVSIDPFMEAGNRQAKALPALGDNKQAGTGKEEKHSLQQTKLARQTRKTIMETALLITLVGTCIVTAVPSPDQSQIRLAKNPGQASETFASQIVFLGFTNTSEVPIIVRIDKQLIALDKGQSMSKAVTKGLHNISWWCEFNGQRITKYLPREYVSENANWNFELLPIAGKHLVLRTKSPHTVPQNN